MLEGVFADVEHGVDVCVEGFDPLVSVRLCLVSCESVGGIGVKGDLLFELVDSVDHILVCRVVD